MRNKIHKTGTEFPGVGCRRLSFPELGAVGAGIPPAAARQAPGGPGLDPPVDVNWTQECTCRNLDQE